MFALSEKSNFSCIISNLYLLNPKTKYQESPHLISNTLIAMLCLDKEEPTQVTGLDVRKEVRLLSFNLVKQELNIRLSIELIH